MTAASGPNAKPTASVAAVDLGSNSFHMVVARAAGSELHVMDRLKESVRLAAGLDKRRRLSAEARDRALDCLARFGQRLRHLPRGRVRAVGTNTLRRARNADEFLADAEQALGHPIEIIYGAEEARLIYGGVARDLAAEVPRRLVVDIGGGSTELIIGEHADPTLIESVSLGAVVHTQRHFASGRVSASDWTAAVLDAQVELEPLIRDYREAGWDIAVGASGSIKAVQKVCAAAGWCEEIITAGALRKLGKTLVKTGRVDPDKLSGLSGERAPIFAGGAAVLSAIFDSLGVEAMQVSDKALREGLLLDLLGRLEHHDVRDATVSAACARYGIDAGHARRVADTATRLCEDAGDWIADEADRHLLHWAGQLHEIGLTIAHKGYHKHGEYIVRNADLQGFSKSDQAVLATLIRLHRGKFRDNLIESLPAAQQPVAARLAVLLRLAVLFHRGRDPRASRPPVSLNVTGKRLQLHCDPDWLAEHPLTRADLEREQAYLDRPGFRLIIDE